MKHRCRAACWLLAGLLLCGCSSVEPPDTGDPLDTESDTAAVTEPITADDTAEIVLPYDPNASLDPYRSNSRINQELGCLLYEGLYMSGDDFMPIPVLAKEITVADLTATVMLREDACFSDGSAVLPADVVYSFERAKTASRYKALLTDFAECVAAGNGVCFTLTRDSGDADACLTFPIIRAATGDVPLGSGKYIFDPVRICLVRADDGTDSANETVRLYPVEKEDELLYALENGEISYYFDPLSDGSVPRAISASLAVEMPYLVFLGLNTHARPFSSVKMRQAVSAAVDRTALAADAFSGYASPAANVFHPKWKKAAGNYRFSSAAAIDTATALIKEAGNAALGEIELIYAGGNPAKKAAANAIAEQLTAVGLRVKAVSLPYATYLSRIRDGEYTAYLGEIRLPHPYDLRSVFNTLQLYDGQTARAYNAYLNGGSVEAVLNAFDAEMPFIPLCYRKGSALFMRSLHVAAPFADQIYYRIDLWTVS